MRSIFSPSRPVRLRNCRLALQSLEGRDVPAGTVTATLAPSGLLTIVGDDDANGLSIRVDGDSVILDPSATTILKTPLFTETGGNPVTLNGVVKSIKADFKGGDDIVVIDQTAVFNVPGSVAFTLGDGDNTLNLVSSLAITMGSLTVKGGDGADSVIVQGGVGLGSKILGAASFAYANGGSSTTLEDVDFGIGIKVTAADGTGNANEVALSTVNVAKTVAVNLGNSNPSSVTLFDAEVGGLTQKGLVAGATLVGSTVLGSVSIKGVFQADLQVDSSFIGKNVAVIAAAASFDASGEGTTIGGNLAITGSSSTLTTFISDSLSEVKGNVSIKGGWFDDVFQTNGFFKASTNVTLALAGGDNSVEIGDVGDESVSILGNLSISTATGNDTIALTQLAVLGSTKVSTLAGKDNVSVEFGSSFGKTFALDTGTGDDAIEFGLLTGSAGPITFTGAAKILAGIGNDSVSLGLAVSELGDAQSRVLFTAAVSLDGGFGIDVLNPVDGQSSSVTPTGFEL